MADLSKHRLVAERAFSHCGVDYCDPFYYKAIIRRNSPLLKAYGAIFVCCLTRALHLELVFSMSPDDFIGALKIFMARRGKGKTMYSDTNFLGPNAELQRLQEQHKKDYTNVIDAFSEDGFSWRFIPRSSSVLILMACGKRLTNRLNFTLKD